MHSQPFEAFQAELWACHQTVAHYQHKWMHTGENWTTESIEINDSALRVRVEEILYDVPDLDFDVAVLSFTPPFKPFPHKWVEFNDAL